MKQEAQKEAVAGDTPEGWKRIEEALDHLLDTDPAEWDQEIRVLSDGDSSLERELRSLAQQLGRTRETSLPDPLESGVVAGADVLFAGLESELVREREEQHGDLGPYRLGERIAVGGMGRVYRAERRDGVFSKEVAVKILRWELPEDDLKLRFAQEREILSRLDHPAVARLLDGGVTADAIPYLVMDLVDGVAIDRYCQEQALSVEQRLRLVLPVIDAVRYAHSQLIIHRDIKPTNVLVEAGGHPKLLDFGVAKLLDSSGEAGFTRTGTGPYTPAFASPEQLLGAVVGTASDLYSLGCLLYLLVTGKRPFEDPLPGIPDPRLQGKLPPAPSTLVSRGKGGFWRDLDAVLLKALRFEPEARYGSAEALARDIGNLLEGLPVEAMAPSWSYRSWKFVRRHALAVTLAGAAVLFLVLGSLAAWQQAQTAQEERDRAQSLANFSMEMLRFSDPGTVGATQISARQLLEGGAERAAELRDRQVRSEVLGVIGEGLGNLQIYEGSTTALLDAAVALGYPETRTRRIAELLLQAAQSSASGGDLERGLRLNREALEILEKDLGPEHEEVARALYERAFLLARFTPPSSPRRQEVVTALERAIRLQTAAAPEGSEALAASLHLHGHQRISALMLLPEPHPTDLIDQAIGQMREAAEIRRRLGGEAAGLNLIESLNDLGLVLDALGRTDEGIALLIEALDEGVGQIDPSHPTVLTMRQNLAALFRDSGRLDEAKEQYVSLIERWRAAELPVPYKLLYGLGFVDSAQGRLVAAEQNARTALALVPDSGAGYWVVATLLGDTLRKKGDFTQAREYLETSAERCRTLLGPRSVYTLRAEEALLALNQAQKR